MADYKDILKMKKTEEYTEEEKVALFDKIWHTAFNYYENYNLYGGDNDDEEFDFKSELKDLATNIVFPDSDEESILELIDKLYKEDNNDEDDIDDDE